MKKTFTCLVAACAVMAMADWASAQLFSDQMTDGTGWGINTSADTTAEFGYDYSVDGIPEAPNSKGGDTATSGLKVTANNGDFIDAAATQTLYPTGQSFTGDYLLRFDAWINYDAVERAGAANGTTEFIGGGIGYDNTSVDIGVGAQAIATGDGGSGSDWRMFDPAFVDAADMTHGSRNGSTIFYENFLPAVPTPAAQGQGSATSFAGSPGFQWLTWYIGVESGIVSVVLEKPGGEKLIMDTWDAAVEGTTTDGNISLYYADLFSSITPAPGLTFGVFDNVTVFVPEPASLSLLAGSLACLVLRRSRA